MFLKDSLLTIYSHLVKIFPSVLLAVIVNIIIFFSLPLLYSFLGESHHSKKERKNYQIDVFQTKPIVPPKKTVIKIPPSVQKSTQITPISAIKRSFKLNLTVSENNQGISSTAGRGSRISTYKIGETDTEPQIIGNPPPPKAPARAKREKVSGQVVIQWVVNEFGRSVEIEVLEENPIGYGFGKQTIHYIKKLRFKPATLQNIPVRSFVKQNFNFQIQ